VQGDIPGREAMSSCFARCMLKNAEERKGRAKEGSASALKSNLSFGKLERKNKKREEGIDS